MLQYVRRGWAIATAGLAVLFRHPKLFLLPLCATLAVAALVAGVLRCAATLDESLGLWPPLFFAFVLLPLFALGCWMAMFVTSFFNAALTSCALHAFADAPPSILAGLAAAGRRLPQLAGRSLSAMTIGYLIKASHRPANNADILAFILALVLSGLVGNRYFPWVAGEFFVMPLLVEAQVPLAEARKRSAVLVRLHWGEKADPAPRLGYLGAVLAAAATLFAIAMLILLAVAGVPSAALVVFSALLPVLLAGISMFAALGAIFIAAVYRHSLSGNAPAGFPEELLRSALDRDSF